MDYKELIEESLDLSVKIAEYLSHLMDYGMPEFRSNNYPFKDYLNKLHSDSEITIRDIDETDIGRLVGSLNNDLIDLTHTLGLWRWHKYDDRYQCCNYASRVAGINEEYLKSHPFPEDNEVLDKERAVE